MPLGLLLDGRGKTYPMARTAGASPPTRGAAAATLLLLDNTVSPIGAVNARTVVTSAAPTTRRGRVLGRIGRIGHLIRLARARRVRRVRNTVASTELRPRHLRATTAIEAGVPNKTNTGRLGVLRSVSVIKHALLKDCAPRALLARVDEATGTEIGTARPVLTGMGRVQLGVVEVLHLGTSPLIRKLNRVRDWGCIGHLRIKMNMGVRFFFTGAVCALKK